MFVSVPSVCVLTPFNYIRYSNCAKMTTFAQKS